ncbi:MAG: FecR domain-containing protein [Elusimicrobia bacterium]|nr:FecR domain-containing protein [Elusimicrobiota bacterium]
MRKIKRFLCLALFSYFLTFLLSYSLYAAAKVLRLQGEVSINGTPAYKGQNIKQDDNIRTAAGSTAIISVNGHRITISEKTSAAVSELKGETSRLKVWIGRIRAMVKKLKARQKFEVKTPTTICAVRGTEFSVDVGDSGISRLEVYEGIVAAREEITGSEVLVNPGQYTIVESGVAPKEPEPMDKEETKAGEQGGREADDIKSEAQREIFMEISRDAVLERAAEEIKSAEYQNGKALIDVSGNRVRLEEYIYRLPDNKKQFKYVVLNERENRFDFGKILFTFSNDLPENLNDATKNMFYYKGTAEPQWYLTDLDSVMSNTYDKILEEAWGGVMVPDDPQSATEWRLFLSNYRFYIGNADSTENSGKGKLMWQFIDNGDRIAQSNEFTYLPGTAYESHTDPALTTFKLQPDGPTTFHFAYRDQYADGTWIEKHDYIIGDDGKIQTFADIVNPSDVSADKIKEKILTLNFENVYTSSMFSDKYEKKIDLIFSSKLLSDCGILSLPSSLSQAPGTN